MSGLLRRILVLMPVGGILLILGGSGGCGLEVSGDVLDSSGYTYVDTTSSIGPDTKNAIIVSGSGEFIDLQYNHLVFPAELNFDSGLYYFAPDPDGSISGDVIICAASITPDDVMGDCFRLGHVCHFDYWNDPTASTDSSDFYYLGETTCAPGADLGPFLVPLESPMCGDDPFPPCPPDNLFPSGLPGDPQQAPPPPPESQPSH